MPSKASRELRRRRRRPRSAVSTESCLDRSRLEWDAPAQQGEEPWQACVRSSAAPEISQQRDRLRMACRRHRRSARRYERSAGVLWSCRWRFSPSSAPRSLRWARLRRPQWAVPSAAACQRSLGRAPAPAGRPVQPPPETPLVDEVTDFVELSVPDDQRYVFPTDDERARFQCGFQYAAARSARPRRAPPAAAPVRRQAARRYGYPGWRPLVLLGSGSRGAGTAIERYRHAWGLYVIAAKARSRTGGRGSASLQVDRPL